MPGVPPTRYAYLGPEGTFTEQAVLTLPSAARAVLLPFRSVPLALDALRAGEADAAVVPLENSVEGGVATTVDELATGEPLLITREIVVEVGFELMARPGTTLDEVHTVATHPHAEAQCRRWLREHLPRAQVLLESSTAQAAEMVAQGKYDAAIAAPVASRRYRLGALASDVADSAGAETRFVLLSRPGSPPPPTGNDKTSLVAFIASDHTGALLEVLTELAVRGINLTRIESRPTRQRMGEYYFVLDFEGHVNNDRVGEALGALYRLCAEVRFLGSYPRAAGEPKQVPERAGEAAFADAHAWLQGLRDGR